MIHLNGRPIGPHFEPFLIAEAGINHNGSMDKAKLMIGVAVQAGADAIKFQTYRADEFVGDTNATFTYQSQGRVITESMLEMLRRCELLREAWFEIKAECDRQGIMFLSTPQSRADLDLLMEVGIPAIKVGSDEFTNLPLISSYATTGLPLILSCGMANMAEVYCSLEHVGALDGYPTVLLSCTSQYPTAGADANLRKITTLRAAFPDLIVGFSDHTEGTKASSMATALGASVIEKHFTLNRDLPGPDHWFAETPDSLDEWVASVRLASIMLGTGIVRPTPAETELARITRRSIVAIDRILPGETFTTENIAVRRPGTGLPPEMFVGVLGCKAARRFNAGEPISFGP